MLLSCLLFAVFFVLMAALIAYVCWTGRVPEPGEAGSYGEVAVGEPDPGEDTPAAA